MNRVIHDGNGTWFDPHTLILTVLTDDQLTQLEDGDHHVLDHPNNDSAWATGYTDDASLAALRRAVAIWLPDAHVVVDADGRVTISSGLVVGNDGDTLHPGAQLG